MPSLIDVVLTSEASDCVHDVVRRMCTDRHGRDGVERGRRLGQDACNAQDRDRESDGRVTHGVAKADMS